MKMCSGDSWEDIENKIKKYNEKPENVEKGRIFAGGDVSIKKIEDICQILQCQPQDLIEWEVKLNSELFYENLCKQDKTESQDNKKVSMYDRAAKITSNKVKTSQLHNNSIT